MTPFSHFPLRRLAALGVLAALACGDVVAQPVEAQRACPVQPAYPLPEQSGALADLARRLEPLAQDARCLRDPFFHAWRGAVLLARGDAAGAVEPLERALLLQPDLPGAQLDLALAVAQQGQSHLAQVLLAQLEQRPDLPAALRLALDQRRREVQGAVAPPRLHQRLHVSVLGGAESNLNNAPAVTELTLTLPHGAVKLPLASSALPRSGAAMLSSLQWQGVRASDSAVWIYQAEARSRITSDRATGYEQADLVATWLQAPEAPRQWIGRGAVTWLGFGGRYLLRATRLGLQHQTAPLGNAWAWAAACRPAAGVELEDRHFPQGDDLDGLYRGVSAGLTCADGAAAGTGPAVMGLQWRSGRDVPGAASRAGGAQMRHELRLHLDRPIGTPAPGVLGPGRLSLQASAVRQADATGYSPLLENNAVRRTTRLALQGEASFSLGGGLYAVTAVEWSTQRSNLAAFTGRQRSVYFGLRWQVM